MILLIKKFGGRTSKLCETNVVINEYTARWFRTEIDLNELAKLRWEKGWTTRRLAAHYGIPKSTLLKRLEQAKEALNGKASS
jgi:hypothetical protein